ncbi:hypothetical protein BpHYR1_017462 [Brachionus plicatilis]|uniref:Uncharacterized protein n=1 Tax=Brachionus plicatilis TaxID=10195 RepID=A0A3M7SMH5_BRAPC|nr:hypothetical protein BpHYR1_017462 [Brachionus plicatilis]
MEQPDSEGGDKQSTNQSFTKADAKKNNDSKNLENNLSTLIQKINKQRDDRNKTDIGNNRLDTNRRFQNKHNP